MKDPDSHVIRDEEGNIVKLILGPNSKGAAIIKHLQERKEVLKEKLRKRLIQRKEETDEQKS